MNFVELFFTTQGRVGRGLFWSCIGIWFLVDLLLRGAVSLASHWTSNEAVVAVFFWIWVCYSVGTYFPVTALLVKRLHDTGRSGIWTLFQHGLMLAMLLMVTSMVRMATGATLVWMLVWLACALGTLVLLVFSVLPGDDGRNEYGAA